ncbi:SpoIIE family protein phosphatase [Actinoplanes sp. NPDC049265]|uniref:SpoIIE family protein phosphatase n=1 Tax=Actinoplanes sp. NPDC049265 TaxID=3363902 RepID=UPI0037133CD5
MTQPADEGLLADAIEQLPFILAACEGPELRMVAVSGATRAVLDGREIIGRPVREVLSDLVGQQFPDAYHQVYATGVPISGQEWRAHLDAPDGTTVELWANFTITPWRNPDGSLRGVIGAGFDVTESVRTRQAAEAQAADLRDVVSALQRELLPAGLPVLPGAQIAASYLPAVADSAAGGDWFDAVCRPDGSVALVVGDVVGHGVTAAGVMGQLRAVLRDRLDTGAHPVDALAAADRFARRLPPAHATTVGLALLDPADGTVTYCTAGHPPPLVVTAAGQTRYLPGTGGTPLGTGAFFPVRTETLDVGDLLILYTDGILERPGRTIAGSTAELAQVAADSAAGRALHAPEQTPAERVCTQTVELLVRTTGHSDDITLLAAQRVPPAAPLDLALAAEAGTLRPARAAIDQWLTSVGATDRDIFLLQHALGELMTNAIEHAFDGVAEPPSAPVVRLHAELNPAGALEATVTDQGRWREPARQSMRGRGLALTSQLVETMRVEPTGEGTVATVRHTLTRPARLLAEAPALRPAVAAAEFRITDLAGAEGGVRVLGVLDTTTAERLEQGLLQRSRGGTLPLTVDLTSVAHLASAGVSALHRVAERHGRQGGKLTLVAAPETPARYVLALVAIPDVTIGPV